MTVDEKIKKFVESADWVFAKTYAKTAPHEYAVRDKNPGLEDEFVYFVKFILEKGYQRKWFKYYHTYFDYGDWYYWTMDDTIEETVLINRAKLSERYRYEDSDGNPL